MLCMRAMYVDVGCHLYAFLIFVICTAANNSVRETAHWSASVLQISSCEDEPIPANTTSETTWILVKTNKWLKCYMWRFAIPHMWQKRGAADRKQTGMRREPHMGSPYKSYRRCIRIFTLKIKPRKHHFETYVLWRPGQILFRTWRMLFLTLQKFVQFPNTNSFLGNADYVFG